MTCTACSSAVVSGFLRSIVGIDIRHNNSLQHAFWLRRHWRRGLPRLPRVVFERSGARSISSIDSVSSKTSADKYQSSDRAHSDERQKSLTTRSGNWLSENPAHTLRSIRAATGQGLAEAEVRDAQESSDSVPQADSQVRQSSTRRSGSQRTTRLRVRERLQPKLIDDTQDGPMHKDASAEMGMRATIRRPPRFDRRAKLDTVSSRVPLPRDTYGGAENDGMSSGVDLKQSHASGGNTSQGKTGRHHSQGREQESWQVQKLALKAKFGQQRWAPRKRLSPDAVDGIRALHTQNPEKFTTPFLANQFKVSAEAIRRILKSKWRPTEAEQNSRKLRWDRRGEVIWSQMVELGVKPPKRWREMGIGKRENTRASDRSVKRISRSGSADSLWRRSPTAYDAEGTATFADESGIDRDDNVEDRIL